jgi:23S rRNA (adenine2503-C2)-methyltransferase
MSDPLPTPAPTPTFTAASAPTPTPAPAPAIQAASRSDLETLLQSWNEPAFRLDQILSWVHLRRANDWEEMSNLPKSLRARLAQHFRIHLPQQVQIQGSTDATRKFLWRLHDGALIESVLIPANPALFSDRSDRHTLCVSTQVGCAYGCRFCASGLDGWKRNLSPDEIVGQVLATERWHRTQNPPTTTPTTPPGTTPPTPPQRLVDNLVIMGMGEPLANYDNLLRALRILNAPWGAGIGARKITVSTSGLAPQIRRLAAEPEQFRLAISLHGATDPVRARIMPVNRKYPIADLTAACDEYLQKKGRMITFEYILLEGVNDDLAQVQPLAALARRLHAKVNLIPYNLVEGLPWKRPDDARCTAFAKALEKTGVITTLRLEKGHDIDAACGQLRLRTERNLPTQTASPTPP